MIMKTQTQIITEARVPPIRTSEYVITNPIAGTWQFRKDANDNRYTVVHHYSELYGEGDKVPYWKCEVHEDKDCEHIRIIRNRPEFLNQQKILHEIRGS